MSEKHFKGIIRGRVVQNLRFRPFKNKNIEPQLKFTGSYKKSVFCLME